MTIFTFISKSGPESSPSWSYNWRRWRVGLLLLEDVVVVVVPLDVVEHGVPVVLPPARLARRRGQEGGRGELTDGRALVHYSHGLPINGSSNGSHLWLLLLLLLLRRH